MKLLKRLLIGIASVGLLFIFVIGPYMRRQTKKHSPEKTATYTQNDMDLLVRYSSPAKKDRIIFGELVPYDEIWRTGANEPTTFTTATDILVANYPLPKGTYSLWTRPGRQSWSVIFNSHIPDWGVTVLSGGKKTTRIPKHDILEIEIPTEETKLPIENLTIDFERQNQLFLGISWDRTKIKIPISK
ncbi:DUF2911 domain-containing protein [Zobellia uliginosa]|nr:DUF2911 domain-containing protein [Zobellia uliginosa]